jgi:putative iron-only hydrogenase system regulator
LESRIAVVSIIIEELESAYMVNSLLHEYAEFIVGRMGLPYRERGLSIISVVLDAPGDVASALSGKLGMLEGVSTKTTVAKQKRRND